MGPGSCHSDRVRVLVVEDEKGMATALARGLGGEGFVVDVAGDGPSGLEAARFGGYDAVILDIMLPGMSGYTVVRTLREERNWVPVLILSAKDGEYDQADGLDYGADDYLTKPFSFVVLLARLRALLRRESGPRATTLEAGDVRLDPSSRRVEVAGTEVGLSRREFLVLEHLLRAHPAVVSRRVAPRRRLGRRRGLGQQRRGGLHRLPAPQDRSGPHRDRPGRRLPDAGMMPWSARLSLRWRLMAVGLVGVVGALLVGGILLYTAMSTALERGTVTEARASATDVAALVNDGRLPEPVPVGGALVVQILDEQNRVLGGSVTADRLTSLLTAAERRDLATGASIVVGGNRAGVDGPLRVAGVEAGPPTARVLVVAGVPTADLETSRRVLRTVLLVVFPLVVLVLVLVSWRVIGLALRPVERLRQGAARIGSAGDSSERLPVLPARDEISALAQTLNDMLGRLASSSAQQRAFVADAAHELRSPLATMRTQLEVAQRLGEGQGLPADLLPEVDRLSALVEDLLVLARSGADAAPPVRQEVSLPDLLTEVVGRYAGARIPVGVSPSPGSEGERAPVVTAARADLVRALGNLVDNAVRHARSGVALTCGTGSGGPRVVVTDDGSGIPAGDLERVFDRFARLDDARDRDSGGSGLGLSITRELLRRNGARVWLEDARPGVRAVVEFGPQPSVSGPGAA